MEVDPFYITLHRHREKQCSIFLWFFCYTPFVDGFIALCAYEYFCTVLYLLCTFWGVTFIFHLSMSKVLLRFFFFFFCILKKIMGLYLSGTPRCILQYIGTC